MQDHDPTRIAKELIPDIEQYGFSFLKGLETRQKIMKYLEETMKTLEKGAGAFRVKLAMMYLHKGEKARAVELLQEQYNLTKDNPGHQTFLLGLAQRLGLAIKTTP